MIMRKEKEVKKEYKLDSVHFACHKIALQQYEKAKSRIGDYTCRCGKEADTDTTVVFTIFKTIESWEPRRILPEGIHSGIDAGSVFMENEYLNKVYICNAHVYCKACADTYEVFSDLDYEDQMEIIIGELEKSGVKMSMPCRPKCAEKKNLLVTYFINHVDYQPIDGEDEYYQACDEAEEDYGQEDAEEEEDDDRGWMKAWRKHNEANRNTQKFKE